MKPVAIIASIGLVLSSCRSLQERRLLNALRSGEPVDLPQLSDGRGEPDLALDAILLDILTSGKPSGLPTLNLQDDGTHETAKDNQGD